MRLTEQQSEKWDDRLHNWASWFNVTDRGGKVKVSSAYSYVASGRPGEGDGIPADVGAALDTHRLILRLDRKHQLALEYRYASTLSDGQSAENMRVDRTTFVHYVRHAKEALHILWLASRVPVSRGTNKKRVQSPTN